MRSLSSREGAVGGVDGLVGSDGGKTSDNRDLSADVILARSHGDSGLGDGSGSGGGVAECSRSGASDGGGKDGGRELHCMCKRK